MEENTKANRASIKDRYIKATEREMFPDAAPEAPAEEAESVLARFRVMAVSKASLRTAIIVPTLCVAALVAGCGGGDDDGLESVSDQDRAAIEKLSQQISRSAKEGDATRLCAIIQPRLVEEVFGGNRRCIKTVKRGLNRNSQAWGSVEIERITVKDDGAIVTYVEDPPGVLLFVREQGEWYLSLGDLALQRQGGTGETVPQGEG